MALQIQKQLQLHVETFGFTILLFSSTDASTPVPTRSDCTQDVEGEEITRIRCNATRRPTGRSLGDI